MTSPESWFDGIGELRIPMETAGDGCESVSFSISVNEIVGGTIVKASVALVFVGRFYESEVGNNRYSHTGFDALSTPYR